MSAPDLASPCRAGASVAVNYHSSRDEAEPLLRKSSRLLARPRHTRPILQIWKLSKHVAPSSRFRRPDILVNNAGLVIRKRFGDTTPEDWHKQIDTCLYGAIHCCHAATPLLEASGRGRIISIMGDSSRVGESGLAVARGARWNHCADEVAGPEMGEQGPRPIRSRSA